MQDPAPVPTPTTPVVAQTAPTAASGPAQTATAVPAQFQATPPPAPPPPLTVTAQPESTPTQVATPSLPAAPATSSPTPIQSDAPASPTPESESVAGTLPTPTVTAAPPPTGAGPATSADGIDFDPDVDIHPHSTGIRVAWVSTAEEDGVVEWALSAEDLKARSGSFTSSADTRPFVGRLDKRTHMVTISSVAPGTGNVLYYQIVSGAVVGEPRSIKLPSNDLLNLPDVWLVGFVTHQDGSPGRGCLVNVRVSVSVPALDTTEHSMWRSDITSETGFYSVDITNIRQDSGNAVRNDFNSAFAYDRNSQNVTVTVDARCNAVSNGTTSVTTANEEKGAAGFVNHNVVVGGPDR